MTFSMPNRHAHHAVLPTKTSLQYIQFAGVSFSFLSAGSHVSSTSFMNLLVLTIFIVVTLLMVSCLLIACCCYDPPPFFAPLLDPLLVTLSKPPLMAKQPLPLNLLPLPELPLLPPSEPFKPSSPLDQPPVLPLVPVPWNIHRWEYSSMELY